MTIAVIRGPRHHWSGARLPLGPRDDNTDQVGADPAQGEAVARCLTCGGIGDGEPLLDFQLLLLPEGISAGRYRLCGACYRHANPPAAADPLDVTTAA